MNSKSGKRSMEMHMIAKYISFFWVERVLLENISSIFDSMKFTQISCQANFLYLFRRVLDDAFQSESCAYAIIMQKYGGIMMPLTYCVKDQILVCLA